MQEEIVNKKIAKKLMENEDQIRGLDFKADEDFILKIKGKEGIKKVEERMVELGCPLKYKEISPMLFYPLGTRVLSLLVIKEVFNFDDEKIKEMGRAAIPSSPFIKVIIRFIGSLPALKEEASKTWRRYHTTGKAELIVDEEDFETIKRPGHSAIIRVSGHSAHPIYCSYLGGYFAKVAEMVIGLPVKSEEFRCVLRGDESHDYLLKW